VYAISASAALPAGRNSSVTSRTQKAIDSSIMRTQYRQYDLTTAREGVRLPKGESDSTEETLIMKKKKAKKKKH
jgi:hypothetical protein